MRFKNHIVSVFLLLVCSLPLSTHAWEPHVLLADIGPSEAAARVVQKTGGKVLRVTLEERDGREVYRVKVLLPEGRIKTVFVDKDSGGKGG
ncbi:MAG: peptidase [Pseudomonadales bacterium]|nr:peptidase [Pseudomonadales bacterium]